ncbi:uncharacterized protein KD926_005170 [Aspergillus affinis]|uniref:uncharacterized protein n=1 Tax=Aspergillus affinis TaxID=1070780 RepID=UPI0022FE4CA5|nr:uncharacterized protein KD926_005170 [Aspergillus affinis]KAI9034879.1 hypothetical protein KD926_005170 [Aspergillus affinis]
METVKEAGEFLFKLLLGSPIITSRIIALTGNYFGQLTVTQDALATQKRETEKISEGLNASNDEIEDAMEGVDLKLDELYVLLLGQDYATEIFYITDAGPDVPQPPLEQLEGMERSDTVKVGVHDVEHVNACFCPERPTSQETKALADKGKKYLSGPASSPDAVQNQQIETIHLLKQQLTILADQKCQLRTQLDLIKSEVQAQREALKISEARIRDLQAREREAEEEREKKRRQAWCSIL